MSPAKIYFIVFGILTIAGGVIGYVKAASVPSIVAGSITGVLLLVAAFLLPEHRMVGLATALIVSLLLAAYFIRKYLSTGAVMPAGIMSLLSVIPLKSLPVSNFPVISGGRVGVGSGVGVAGISAGATRCNRSSEIQR